MARSKLTDRDKGWNELMKLVKDIHQDKLTLKVGVISSETREGSDLNEAEIAAVLELGTRDKTIPPRPFLRATFDEQVHTVTAMARKLLGRVLDRKLPPEAALEVIGGFLSDAIKAKIVTGPFRPNTPAVAYRKANRGRTARFFKGRARTLGKALARIGAIAAVKPLIDTGRMLGGITYAIIKGRPKE